MLHGWRTILFFMSVFMLCSNICWPSLSPLWFFVPQTVLVGHVLFLGSLSLFLFCSIGQCVRIYCFKWFIITVMFLIYFKLEYTMPPYLIVLYGIKTSKYWLWVDSSFMSLLSHPITIIFHPEGWVLTNNILKFGNISLQKTKNLCTWYKHWQKFLCCLNLPYSFYSRYCL
jgi:hypothetical protein